ncbi:hypothetical protein NHX12_000384, partial [Muraenolepis orangiensis]
MDTAVLEVKGNLVDSREQLISEQRGRQCLPSTGGAEEGLSGCRAGAKLKARRIAKLKARRIAKLKARRIAKLKARRIAKLKARRIAKLKARRIAKLKARRIAKLKARRIAKLKARRIAKLKARLQCQHNIKSHLMQKFRRVFEGIAKAGQSTDLNDFYTELFITQRVSGEVNKEHEVRLIETASRKPAKEETPIKCEDIFKPLPGQDQPSRTIMTTGVAGIGKTILTHKFTLDWAEGKANHDIHFTLPFTFRELNLLKEKEFSLMELLHHFFIQTKGILRYDLFQVVFILDGLDECRLPLDFQNNPIWTDVTKSTSVDILLTNLIRGDLLPSARIWITTRPAAANQIPAECVDMVTEVRGFTDPQKEEYF